MHPMLQVVPAPPDPDGFQPSGLAGSFYGWSWSRSPFSSSCRSCRHDGARLSWRPPFRSSTRNWS